MKNKYSIVINTLNRAPYLADALAGLIDLKGPDFEVIVVNGPSTDNTEDVLKPYANKIKIGRCDEANLSVSRNVGIQMAAGDIICFIDDDAVPHPDWLIQLDKHYSDPSVGAVGGYTIDNTGARFQVKKTVCDRYGNAYSPSDFFDERSCGFPHSPVFPSLLGTNSSFRASHLKEIGGFDHTFAYLLDETDVCLRLTDMGKRVVYEPNALVFHQFAPSHIRSSTRIPKTLYPSAVSKSYFISTHGHRFNERKANAELEKYKDEILRANHWLHENGRIEKSHMLALNDDLLAGIIDGQRRASQKRYSTHFLVGDLNREVPPSPFKSYDKTKGLTVILVSRSFPPMNDAGIARWTWQMAIGLTERGHRVHVITQAGEAEASRFESGYWVHHIRPYSGSLAEKLERKYRIPGDVAAWAAAVRIKAESLAAYDIDVISTPIWDVEGMAFLDDMPKSHPALVLSLHTSYLLAKKFKPEWSARPLFEHFHVNRIVAAEKLFLSSVDNILANSNAIIDDIEQEYDVSIREKSSIAAHGTFDPIDEIRDDGRQWEEYKRASSRPVISYIGRFENRKGFDIACDAISHCLNSGVDATFRLIGDELQPDNTALAKLIMEPRVEHVGVLSRKDLQRQFLSSDIVIMPSRYESFGLVAIEAMAAGAVVVALAAGGLKEVIDDQRGGFLVTVGDDAAKDIYRIVADLVSQPIRLRQQQGMARKCFEEKYTVREMAKQAEAVYEIAARRRNHAAA